MIRAATPSEIEWVCGKLPLPYSSSMKGVCNDGAMVVYDSWTKSSVQAHIYSSGPRFLLDPLFLREIFSYAFGQCGKLLIYTITPADAKASLAVSKALGFSEVFRQKDGWDVGIDMVYKEMRKEDCRWIKRIH